MILTIRRRTKIPKILFYFFNEKSNYDSNNGRISNNNNSNRNNDDLQTEQHGVIKNKTKQKIQT